MRRAHEPAQWRTRRSLSRPESVLDSASGFGAVGYSASEGSVSTATRKRTHSISQTGPSSGAALGKATKTSERSNLERTTSEPISQHETTREISHRATRSAAATSCEVQVNPTIQPAARLRSPSFGPAL